MKSQNILPKKQVENVFTLYSNGEFEQAVDSIKLLNKSYPNQPLLFNLIGACYKELGELHGAVKMFESAISLSPNYAEAHFNLGVVNQDLDEKIIAIESYKNAIEAKSVYPEAYNNLGNILRELGDYKASIDAFEWAIAQKHDFFEAYNNLGGALSDFGRTEDAIKSFKKAISYKSDYAGAIFNLALAYKDLGKKALWLEMIEKTLILRPDWSKAYLELSRIKKFNKNDPIISKIHKLLSGNKITINDQINFNFTLAKVYEDIKDRDRQFKYLNEANRLRKNESGYSIEKDKALFLKIKDKFINLPSILDNLSIKKDDIKPIFIVGMPRSGTSLVHQIISSHRLVHGAGELTKIYKFVMPHLSENKANLNSTISEDALLMIRNQYLDYLSSINAQEKIIIDKMPLNFRFIGFIIASFPDAKIVHLRRNPLATCWSIYKNYFPGNTYSYNQEDIASYYNLYENLMTFWKELFPNKIFDLCYEELTLNQEKETRALLNYCDLEWDENCLNFESNNTAVKTTSSMQVKKKMYQGSSDAWKKYDKYLQPLIEGLKDKKNIL